MKWEFGIITENKEQVNYYLYLSRRLVEGFYQRAGFSVLPKSNLAYAGIVIYPKSILELTSTKFKNTLPQLNKNGLILSAKVDYSDFGLNFDIPEYSHIQKFLSENEDAFLTSTQNLLTLMGTNLPIEKVVFEVIPTYMGTAGTSSHTFKKNTLTLRATLRADLNTNYLVETYIQGLIIALQDSKFANAEKNINMWQKREAIIHFFLHNSTFKELLNDKLTYKDTLPAIEDLKIWGNIINESNAYLASLGLDSVAKIELDERMLKINDFAIYLTGNQSKLMRTLVNNRGKIVDFDQLGDSVWENDEDKFSLQALAKEISRIRQKIYDSGFSANLIFTARKKGILLK